MYKWLYLLTVDMKLIFNDMLHFVTDFIFMYIYRKRSLSLFIATSQWCSHAEVPLVTSQPETSRDVFLCTAVCIHTGCTDN